MIDQAQSLRKSIDEYMRKKKNKIEKRQTRVIVIASGKGGVGKTNFSVNLAIALSQMGKSVLVFDADLGLANVDVVVGVIPKYSLYDVIFNNKSMKEIIIEGPSGIKIVPGGSGIESLSNLTDIQRSMLADKFGELNDTDIIIIDTGAGISKNVVGFITVADEVIVVTTPEPTSITDAYSFIKVASKYSGKTKMHIVINRAFNDKEADSTYLKIGKAIKNFLNMDINYLGYIIDDAKVKRSVMEQTPFKVRYPDCHASKCVDTIAASILGQEAPLYKTGGIKDFLNKVTYLFGRM